MKAISIITPQEATITVVTLKYTKRRLSRLGILAISGLILIVVAAIIGPFLWPWDAFDQHPELRLETPSWAHPFGTDQYGRDLLARVLGGSRWSLAGAVLVCLGTSLIGFTIGAISALGGPVIDALLSRIMEAVISLPGIVTALAFSAVLGPSFPNLLLALVLTNWPWYARTYRNLILKERAASYIEGAVAVGATRLGQLRRHILPNIVGPALVIATINFGSVILNLSALSFLGLGMQPPTPEWGTMISEARTYFQVYPFQMIAPGLCIAFTLLTVNLSGDALRDLIDPHTRQIG